MTSNGKGLQLQRQTEMLTRRLPIARTAPEKIAKEWAPEITFLAQMYRRKSALQVVLIVPIVLEGRLQRHEAVGLIGVG